jgi:hypothetical protein
MQRVPDALVEGSVQGFERPHQSGRLALTDGAQKHCLVAVAFAYPVERSSVIETRFSYPGLDPCSQPAYGYETAGLARCQRACCW